MAAAPDPSGQDVVVLHSSWSGLVLSSVGAVLFFVLAVGLLIADGFTLLSVFVFVLSLVLLGVVAFDMPVASYFDDQRVIRRTALRRHEMRWEDVDRLSRLRVGVFRTRRDLKGGGLVAKLGWRSYTLVDRLESATEFDAVVAAMGDWADALGLGSDQRPPDGRTPTWMYRSDRWKP